ncbi:MAG: hypothetical protein K1X94_15015 [Sandaracinaceae bacterium]|nr:hypothetical protein [Sandaracinaceae bacterium]
MLLGALLRGVVLRGAVPLAATLLVAALTAGCGGFSYVYRSPVREPLGGVEHVGVHLEAVATDGNDLVAQRLASGEDALIGWLEREGRAASFDVIRDEDETTLHVLLTADPRARPDPREVTSGGLRIAVRITLERAHERIAIVEGTASTRTLSFHGLIDPDLSRVLERLAHRLSRILAELGLR